MMIMMGFVCVCVSVCMRDDSHGRETNRTHQGGFPDELWAQYECFAGPPMKRSVLSHHGK